jgi:hypothetical protein
MSSTGKKNIKEQVRVLIHSQKGLNPNTDTGSNFTYSFNKDIIRIIELRIDFIQIQYTFYSINPLNNVLSFNGGAITATIPPGNYSVVSLATTLQTVINTAFGDTSTLVTFSNSTFLLTITRGTNFNVDSFKDQSISTAAPILGYGISTTSGLTATGNYALNISGPNYLILNSIYLSNLINNKMIAFDGNYNNAIAAIAVNTTPGNIILVKAQDYVPIIYSIKHNIYANDVIDFTLTDEFGNIIDLKGSPVTMQLVFTIE